MRFGFNVYPAEVEAVLNSHSAVARSAIIGRTVGGEEEIIAFIQLKSGKTADSNDIASYTLRNLASYKQPSQIFFLKELPLTPTGKVAKDELARMLANGLPAH